MNSDLPLQKSSALALASVWLVALILIAGSIWIYWPGISGPELLDDRSSVMVIGDLRARPELAWDYVFGDKSGILGRPVSMASFVLEKLYLDEGIAGNKKVNIFLHACNGALLMWLFCLLFRVQRIPAARGLAMVLGAIWLLHPLFVSTVLYAVQRMAMLATFFMLASSIAYVYWRLSLLEGKGSWWRFLPIPLLLIIALLAKENAIVLLPVLLVLEVLWFECKGLDGKTLPWLNRLAKGSIAAGAIAGAAILILGYGQLAARFSKRAFSLDERLLTQARVVWDYVVQFFIPQIERMGLYHDDYVVSQGLTEPLITLYAVLAWAAVAVCCAGLLRWQWGRYLVVGIAWFVLGHSVESTVLPLEIYFEHRNYFPAIGLLLFVGVILAAIFKRWHQLAAPLIACVAVYALLLSAQTSSQVQMWSNRTLLLMNHLNAHPQSTRANNDMAVELASRGELAAAHEYSRRAFVASANAAALNERIGDYIVRDLALSCVANQPAAPELIDQLGRDDAKRPLSSVTTLLTLVRQLQGDYCPTFDRLRFANRLAHLYLESESPATASPRIYSNLAVLENALGRYDKAYAYVDKMLAVLSLNRQGLLMKLHFATALNRVEDADEVKATLLELDARGKLTRAEQQTLALYLKN